MVIQRLAAKELGNGKDLGVRRRHPSDNAWAVGFSASRASSSPPPTAEGLAGRGGGGELPEITLLVLAPLKPACLLGSFLRQDATTAYAAGGGGGKFSAKPSAKERKKAGEGFSLSAANSFC